jgi:hypothetical protein
MFSTVLKNSLRRLWLWFFRKSSQPAALPRSLERRGALQVKQAFPDTDSVVACITATVSAQQKGAREKMANPAYWRNTGEIELNACLAALRVLESVDVALPVPAYLHQLQSGLLTLVEQYRSNDLLDPDGYGLGTLQAIAQVVSHADASHAATN